MNSGRKQVISLVLALAAGTALEGAARAGDACRVTLGPTDPTWNRPKDTGSTVSTICGATALDSQNDGVPYRVVQFTTTTSEILNVTAVSQEAAASSFDPFIGLYCAGFNAANPLANLIALDDDSAGYPNAALTTARSIQLLPSTTYMLVVSAYSGVGQSPYGTVLLSIGGNATFTKALAGCCKADFNQDGRVTVQDIFSFLSAWFAKLPSADVDGSGADTVQDIFNFLSAWFAGCQ